MNDFVPVITIDGPSGTGKGTLCLKLAHYLGWHMLDSGALYRLLALSAKLHAVALDNDAALEVLARHLDAQFVGEEQASGPRIILEGEDVTEKLRTEECGQNASTIAVFPTVRNALLDRQRAFAESPGLVTDGRDMGTVVFPNATLKVFLLASPKVRAERRYLQLKEKGINASLAQVVEELTKRDKRDSERQAAPLKAAPDAIKLDTSGLSIDEVLEQVIDLVKESKLNA